MYSYGGPQIVTLLKVLIFFADSFYFFK